MAQPSNVTKARGALASMALVLLLLAGGIFGTTFSGGSWLPKLALDLSGGTQLILSPEVNDSSGEAITAEQLDQAVEIIRQRVDGAGVAEAEITTQSGQNVVVSVPGTLSSETRNLIQTSAQMSFRAVINAGAPQAVAADATAAEDALPSPTAEPADGSDYNWVTGDLWRQYEQLDCTVPANVDTSNQDPNSAIVACASDGSEKYILGPIEIEGTDIDTASYSPVASSTGYATGQWGVNIVFNEAATQTFKDVTTRLNAIRGTSASDPRARFAIMLDGQVLSSPVTQAVITNGQPQITGNFTEEEAANLAEQLKYGALPISFTIQSEQQISATLGADQLKMGLIAGLIGLLLVFIYSLFQYRLVGLVNITSIIVAGLLSYGVIVLLGHLMNYRLSLAGVAGLIVSIGLMADSFIVYFERIRDEIRAGRTIPAAIDHGWLRAKRTIMASKAVNLLAAVVLYFASVGNVRGFAFTLGLTAVSDLIITFLFIHPLMVLLGRKDYFRNGGRFSGMDPVALGSTPLYRGAGRVRTPEETEGSLSLAERKRRERLAAEAAEAEAAQGSADGEPLPAADSTTTEEASRG
ncbi:MAG TPA: protein translocase subunit SecD [Candidatus Rothia avistercoris]|uniref:Protein translocase subunit SecD n=1 Tax=Candidatus Rothia avistercoris TaxID=2840479 RepID=A0A9D2UFE0_9MICC|nr:protein translocase subunit SecD [Candidatus Rothia avistercoris]